MRPPIEISRLEETRQAVATADVAGVAEEIAGGVMGFTAPGSWSNQAVGLGLDGPVGEAEIDRLVAFYRGRGCEPRIEVSPFAHATLLGGLAARGFVLENFENVLARELDPAQDLRALHPHGWPVDTTLERVDPQDDAAVEEWVEVSTCGFRPLDEPMPEHQRAISRRMALHPRCVCLTARVGSHAAAGAALERLGELGALFGTSVHPDFRRRGLQLALMLERLALLREDGVRLVTIGSRPGISTERNALRIGFQVAYSKVVLVQPGEGMVPAP